MSDRSFSRRRKGGMRFRPTGGLGSQQQKPDRAAAEARAEVLADVKVDESVFDQDRHANEIERAENVAAGLPPEGTSDIRKPANRRDDFRQPRRDRPRGGQEAEEKETKLEKEVVEVFRPVPVADAAPKSIVDSIRIAATKVIEKVQRLIRPTKRVHKEIVINTESLETRVAVLEEGKLEEFTIERTGEERLVGSIFKGRVKNLEDGLKAAFVDIGFEKNAFLHYWDIVPNNFDSTVEIVERDGKKKEKPRITQRDIPRLYPVGSEIIIQVTKGPIGTKGPRVTTNLSLPGRFLVLLPNSDQCGISRKIENHEERQRLKKILRKLSIPEGMGVIIRTAGEEQQARYFVRDLALLLEEWKGIQERMQKNRMATCVYQEPDLIERTVRDILTEDYERIVIDSQ
jgi:ribonuclease G